MTDAPSPDRRKRRPLVEVDRISKLFTVSGSLLQRSGLVRVVDNVSLYVRHGETLGLIGRTGAGKSVLGHTILRLTEPTYGRIKYDDRDLTQLSQRALRPIRRDLQIVFQDPRSSLDPRLTVRDAIGEPLRTHRVFASAAETRDRIEEIGAEFGLGKRELDQVPESLSAGQAQRAALARALSTSPRFVVLDDPLTYQDARTRSEILARLAERQEEHRNAYLLIGHDVRVVASLSHRIAVMYFGRIVEVGPTRDLVQAPLHPYTRALMHAQAPLAPKKRQLRVLLEGSPPSPFSPPSGCAFHLRCPRAEAGRCDQAIPDLAQRKDDTSHRVACFHPGTS